ncbi:helix-turn-helix domain-containing protein [Arenibacter algicola]|uniref:helix-turn-helix domain-containing protein n=1 Tax=Arenibacter algicola TaxID=616991 RepID=UPI001C069BC9|nr:helix-turn-helix transcriptional regulator [Arenibacter algicola]MBU2903482.1 helix-turn-helix domain-containing protein [Arenibacter algicola]
MNENPKDLLELLNIQIGCVIKINRLRQGISQHDLSLVLDFNPTAIGRIERAEVISGWDRIYILSQELRIPFSDLFVLLSESDLLLIVDEIISLEQKLNDEKKEFYRTLISKIKIKFTRLQDLR